MRSSLLRLFLGAAASVALLAGCGGGDVSPNSGEVRLVNATDEFGALDLYEGSDRLTPGVAPFAAGNYEDQNKGDDTFSVRGGVAGATIASLDATVARLRFAASYSHLYADVTESLSSGALTPSFNPAFPGIPIGNFSPLKGQRPFRRPANTGNLLVSYSQGPATVALSGYFAGKSNDSTFLGGSDINFGNSLLLPNEDLNPGYQKLDLSASYLFHRSLKVYTTVENLLNQHYEPAFGFPGLPLNVRAGVTITVGGR